jgi:hypothetical protein
MPIDHVTGWLFQVAGNRITDLFRRRQPERLGDAVVVTDDGDVIFGLRQITFWQALGLLALSRILFGSFGRGGGPRRETDRRHREWWRKPPRQDGLASTQNTVSEGGQS